MYQQQALTRRRQSRSMGRNRNLEAHSSSKTLGPVSSALFLIAIVGVLSLLYLTQVTKTSVYGYETNQLKEEQAQLLEQQQELQVEAARLQSVARVENSPVVDNMEAADTVTYDDR